MDLLRVANLDESRPVVKGHFWNPSKYRSDRYRGPTSLVPATYPSELSYRGHGSRSPSISLEDVRVPLGRRHAHRAARHPLFPGARGDRSRPTSAGIDVAGPARAVRDDPQSRAPGSRRRPRPSGGAPDWALRALSRELARRRAAASRAAVVNRGAGARLGGGDAARRLPLRAGRPLPAGARAPR